MRNFRGIAKNIDKQIVGLVKRHSILPIIGKSYIFVGNDIPKYHFGVKAIISSSRNATKITQCASPLIYNFDNPEQLHDGDIILIEPNGSVNVLFEAQSDDNVLFVTQRCNCSCMMCPQVGANAAKDDYRLLNLQLVSLINKRTKHLGITGGEPTVKRDELLELISQCKKILPNTALDLLTNGILFEDFNFVKGLADIKHPNLTVLTSLYADTDQQNDKIIGTKGFHKTIKGIYNLALFRQRIEIRTVISKMTYKRLSNLSEFIYRNFPFVAHVAFMGLELEGVAQERENDLYLEPGSYVQELERGIRILHRGNIPTSIYNHPLCLLPNELWPFARKSISSWKVVYPKVCEGCTAKPLCGGLFKSIVKKQAKQLKAITNV